jgi:hypothetical protein
LRCYYRVFGQIIKIIPSLTCCLVKTTQKTNKLSENDEIVTTDTINFDTLKSETLQKQQSEDEFCNVIIYYWEKQKEIL